MIDQQESPGGTVERSSSERPSRRQESVRNPCSASVRTCVMTRGVMGSRARGHVSEPAVFEATCVRFQGWIEGEKVNISQPRTSVKLPLAQALVPSKFRPDRSQSEEQGTEISDRNQSSGNCHLLSSQLCTRHSDLVPEPLQKAIRREPFLLPGESPEGRQDGSSSARQRRWR